MFLYGPVTSRKFSWKPENRQLVPKSPIFKMTENHHGAQFYMWGQIQMPTTYISLENKFYQD